jgi:hypothetical protein
MANLSSDEDSGMTEPIDPTLPEPSGQVHVSAAHHDPESMTKQLRTHLAEHQKHLDSTSAYGGHGQRHGPAIQGAQEQADAASDTSSDQSYNGNT